MQIHLLKLQQEGVVALRTIYLPQARIRNIGCELFLFSECEQAVGFDAEDERGLLDLRQRRGDGRRAVAGHVVRIEFARYGDIAVRVEAFDKLLALIP